MSEAEARLLLRNSYAAAAGSAAWIAGRRWQAALGGWIVDGELEGWSFKVEVIPAGLRIGASALGGGDPAVWIVTAAGKVTGGG